jgi:hypothetical protein
MTTPLNLCWPVLLLLTLGQGCGHRINKTQPMIDETLTTQTDDVLLSAHFRSLSDTSLQITYRVQNKTGQSLYLFNQLYEASPDQTLRTGHDLVYVFLEPEHVLVCKAIAPVPPNLTVAIHRRPYATKIAPHALFTEKFVVGLPLMPKTPYMTTLARSKRVVFRPLVLGLGYAMATASSQTQEQLTTTPEGQAIYFKGFNYNDQQWLHLGPLKQPVMAFETR